MSNKYAIAMVPGAEDLEEVQRWFAGQGHDEESTKEMVAPRRLYVYSSRASGGFCRELCEAALFVQHKTALKTARELASHYHADTRFEVVTVAFAEAAVEFVEAPSPEGFAVMITAASHVYMKLPCFVGRKRWSRNYKMAQVFKTQAAAQKEIDEIVAACEREAEEERTANKQAEEKAQRTGQPVRYHTWNNEPPTSYQERAATFRAEVIKLTAGSATRLNGLPLSSATRSEQ